MKTCLQHVASGAGLWYFDSDAALVRHAAESRGWIPRGTLPPRPEVLRVVGPQDRPWPGWYESTGGRIAADDAANFLAALRRFWPDALTWRHEAPASAAVRTTFFPTNPITRYDPAGCWDLAGYCVESPFRNPAARGLLAAFITLLSLRGEFEIPLLQRIGGYTPPPPPTPLLMTLRFTSGVMGETRSYAPGDEETLPAPEALRWLADGRGEVVFPEMPRVPAGARR